MPRLCARAFPLLGLLLFVPGSARGSLQPERDCDDLLPQVVNVGVPQALGGGGFSLEAVRDAARGRLSDLYQPLDRCDGRRRLQVNIAIGNDYQILDWLGQGLIDVAVVPDLSLYLLHRDGVELFAPPPESEPSDRLLAPSIERLRSRNLPEEAWADSGEPERDLESFRWQLWCASAEEAGAADTLAEGDRRRCAELARGPRFRIALPSHLSTGGFLRPVSATAAWFAAKLAAASPPFDAEGAKKVTERFWTAFFEHTRFTLDGMLEEPDLPGKPWVEIMADAVPASPEEPAAPADATPFRDHLVITARAADSIFAGNAYPRAEVALPVELRELLEGDSVPDAFRPLLQAEPHFGVRTYGFTVGETLGLLRQHQKTSGRARLALVLPGGGVKAVYQSHLVDSLYSQGSLKNANTSAEPRPGAAPLDVDFVIGTSGGALLGYFVARLAENGPWNLSDVLWQNEDLEILDSTDIFGWADLPRYLSIVAIFFVFALLLFVATLILRAPIPVAPVATEDSWRPRLLIALLPLLLLTPILIRWVNGQHSQEHIPEIEGMFYFVCASVAIFADQCLVFRQAPRRSTRRLLPPTPPLLVGLVLVVLPLLPIWAADKEGNRWVDRPFTLLGGALPGGSALICLGILSLLAAGILWTAASRHYRIEEADGFRAGFSLSLALVAAVYGVLLLVMHWQRDLLSPLELTGPFWGWLLAVTSVLGISVLIAGCLGRNVRGLRWIFGGLQFLVSYHPNSALLSRRFLRMAALTITAFLWWNFVVAPALYGNAHAREFLSTAENRFHREYAQKNPGGDVHRLTAHLIVPANVLERDGTRYFLVVAGETCPPISRKPASGASWYTYRIRPQGWGVSARPPVCQAQEEQTEEQVEAVIFASGSPFPIFPAHLVKLKDQENPVALVDGGYSNNEPVDAALSVSAEQVLLVESTNPLGPVEPAGQGETEGRGSLWKGPLVADLLRLPGFLFERSQQVDRLSRRGLFVVSLSPSRDRLDWPALFDFRHKVVLDLGRAAEEDLSRRIGLVESWGPPRFQLSVSIGGGGSG